jgi:Uma2 family endonuclease
MGDPALTPQERFTYRHYRTWPEGERWELIRGVAYSMSPAPLRNHQRMVGRFFARLDTFLTGKPCQAYVAPFDVLLPEGAEPDDAVDTVVQPDIVVYCDPSKLTREGARGSPDLVAEILSPSTSRKDQREKFDLYQKSGVREYWVIDPAGTWLCVYRLVSAQGASLEFDGGELRDPVRDRGPISSRVLEGFVVDPEELFADLD